MGIRLACTLLVVLLGCSGSRQLVEEAGPMDPDARILSAFYGLDRLPLPVLLLCGPGHLGEDGMPVTFSIRVDDRSLSPDVFAVVTASGERVKPECATLRPATEPLERHTVLLTGTFGTIDAQPGSVEVVGDLRDVNGNTLRGLRLETTPLEVGPSIVIAERFGPQTPGLAGECPEETTQVVQLVWEGGVTGPDGADLGEPQRLAVTVTLENGEAVTPIALADDDPDNYVHACLATASPAISVAVDAGFFHDPRDDANPATTAQIVGGRE